MPNTDDMPEEKYEDVIDFEVTERAAIKAESELLRCEIDSLESDHLKCGVTVFQDGSLIAIKGGSIDESQGPRLYSYNGLTPSQARRLSKALEQAADQAEEAKKSSPEQELSDDTSFLRRLLS